MNIFIYTYIYTYIYIYACTYIFIYISIHLHIQNRFRLKNAQNRQLLQAPDLNSGTERSEVFGRVSGQDVVGS